MLHVTFLRVSAFGRLLMKIRSDSLLITILYHIRSLAERYGACSSPFTLRASLMRIWRRILRSIISLIRLVVKATTLTCSLRPRTCQNPTCSTCRSLRPNTNSSCVIARNVSLLAGGSYRSIPINTNSHHLAFHPLHADIWTTSSYGTMSCP